MKGMTSTKYPTDLTDAQWDKLLPYLPEPSSIGRPLKWEMRSIINAIFYIVKTVASLIKCHRGKQSIPTWKTLGTMIHQALHEHPL